MYVGILLECMGKTFTYLCIIICVEVELDFLNPLFVLFSDILQEGNLRKSTWRSFTSEPESSEARVSATAHVIHKYKSCALK